MNPTGPIARISAGDAGAGAELVIRPAGAADVPDVVAAVGRLLSELGGAPPDPLRIGSAAQSLIGHERAGVLLVARSAENLLGVLGASWQLALHAGGIYGLIQDLWVEPAWRERRIGQRLLRAFHEHALRQGISRLEVGLPTPRYEHLEATRRFYAANGYEPVGLRMRSLL